ncbi:MJ0144 family RNA dihydrouridine synthase-like protein [Methanococcus voltae]|uniref:TIM-barrel protein n=1 Tax=Methanococcus voltae (strain ATCC BAA-1334 / A3) TaxID=456320 RepID=D7DR27_METV3|nr:MJ0144 family RNA dihydrouridine synthase-like protein [Methanococcus voltae]MCS3900964.1 TIM-barrel protein [Methanococcus voltae]
MANLKHYQKLKKLKNKIVLAPMAGITDAKFCKKFDNFGIICIGAYNLDNETLKASFEIENRGRKEFNIPLNKFSEYIKNETFEIKNSPYGKNSLISANIRFKDLDLKSNPYLLDNLKTIIENCDIIEFNCHCRQPEITNLGLGQELITKKGMKNLCNILKFIKDTNIIRNINITDSDNSIPVFIKIRANYISSEELIKNFEENSIMDYIDGIHIDCFNPGHNYADLDYLKDIRIAFPDIIIIGNNSVKSVEDAKKMLKYCDFVSVARCVLSNNIEWIKKIK